MTYVVCEYLYEEVGAITDIDFDFDLVRLWLPDGRVIMYNALTLLDTLVHYNVIGAYEVEFESGNLFMRGVADEGNATWSVTFDMEGNEV